MIDLAYHKLLLLLLFHQLELSHLLLNLRIQILPNLIETDDILVYLSSLIPQLLKSIIRDYGIQEMISLRAAPLFLGV